MPQCELSGKGPVVKNKVSHSNIKTKSRAMRNIQSKHLFSQSLGQLIRLKISTHTLRSLEHQGGLDAYILKCPNAQLSHRAAELKKRIMRKIRPKAAKPTKALTQDKV